MELKYSFYIQIGVIISICVLLLFVLYKAKAKGFKDGVKIANIDLLLSDDYIKSRMIAYKILRALLIASVIFTIMAAFVVLARPYYIRKTKEQRYNRDIMICLDISTSVDELNKKLVKDLQKLVKNLNGERIGIVIFNTTPVLLSPLTDDYGYIIEQLENIGTGIKIMSKDARSVDSGEWLYWNSYLYGGTLVGNMDRGSSLIGDGLLGALFNFPEEDTDRTRVIIFSTDNELNGDGYVTLPEAAQYCAENKVYVYGIGTDSMIESNMNEMRRAVELTKGKFYLEENESTFHNIVDDIEELSSSLVEGRTIIEHVESPEKAYIALCIGFLLTVILLILLRRINIVFFIVNPLIAAMLAAAFVFVIDPAKNVDGTPALDIKKDADLDVLFVVDDTLSMLADDVEAAEDGATRLTKAKQDCAYIVDELDGAKFSVISFNNNSQVLTPYSNNGSHVKNIINSIYPLDEFYANGSSLNTPRSVMRTSLERIKENDNNKTAVFFLSDGEITDGSDLDSYKELSGYIDFGAVLGYGTDEGGQMTIMNYLGEPDVVKDYSDYPIVPAVSKIDENNLKNLAADLNIEYINMTDGNNVMSVVSKIKSNIDTSYTVVSDENDNETVTIEMPENRWYGLFFLIVALILVNAGYIIVRK